MHLIKKYFYGFWQTVGFLITIPLPGFLFSKNHKLMSPAAMGFVGVAVGLVIGGVFVSLLAVGVFHVFAAILAMVVGVILTGCLHEDGFADFCDSYFGKSDPKKILTIMKDSHIGTFGVVGLIILFYTRFTVLVLMFGWQLHYILLVLMIAAGLSRLAMTFALFLPLKKKNHSSLHHVARPTILSLVVSLQIFWLVAFLPNEVGRAWWWLPMLLGLQLLVWLKLFFFLHRQKKLPLTGDGLGFLQVLTEVTLLGFLLSYFGFQQ